MLETKGMKIHGKAKVQECQEEQVNINAVLLKLYYLNTVRNLVSALGSNHITIHIPYTS